jgi:recombinational DNA repair protein (RecF pathway)
MGKIRASAKRARYKTSRIMASTSSFHIPVFVLFENRGPSYGRQRRTGSSSFFGLSSDIGLYSLASYFAELLDTVGDSDTASPELLRLALNALYPFRNGFTPGGL